LVPFIFRAALCAAAALATVVILEAQAHAAELASAGVRETAGPTPPIAWDVRLDATVGAGSLAFARDGSLGWRFGVDTEYWVSRYVGVGFQVGYEEQTTLDWCLGSCNSAHVARMSIAPSITARGSNPSNYPMATLSLGLGWGHEETSSSCDPSDTCTVSFSRSAADTWGPYGSLTLAWIFHAGDIHPGIGSFAVGPMIRADGFSLLDTGAHMPNLSVLGWSFLTGITLGVGAAGGTPR
jgi:hypothetical protein